MKKKLIHISIALFAVAIGLYPIVYVITDARIGILSGKEDFLLASNIWWSAFYAHICFGGLSLLLGWSQFIAKWRTKFLNLHRMLGKGYVISVTLSGLAAAYLALYATGGIISSFGFGMLAVSWLFSTWKAFLFIRGNKVEEHQVWMMRSYALTFAAVTLRIWLPLSGLLGIEFIVAYKIIAWLCWVPNLLFIEYLIFKRTSVHENVLY